MSTWQIFSDAGNDFRWEPSDRDLQIKPDDESPNGRSTRLPSMSDLALQGNFSLSLSVNLSVSFVFCGSISDLVRYRMCEASGESQRRIWEFSDVPNRVGEIGCGETVFVSEGLIGSRRRCGDQFRYHNLTLSIFIYVFELNKKTVLVVSKFGKFL